MKGLYAAIKVINLFISFLTSSGDGGDGADGGERGLHLLPQRSRQRQGKRTTHHVLHQHRPQHRLNLTSAHYTRDFYCSL